MNLTNTCLNRYYETHSSKVVVRLERCEKKIARVTNSTSSQPKSDQNQTLSIFVGPFTFGGNSDVLHTSCIVDGTNWYLSIKIERSCSTVVSFFPSVSVVADTAAAVNSGGAGGNRRSREHPENRHARGRSERTKSDFKRFLSDARTGLKLNLTRRGEEEGARDILSPSSVDRHVCRAGTTTAHGGGGV